MLTVELQGGPKPLTALLAVPDGDGPYPAIVLLPAIAGVNAYTKAAAARLAGHGYVTLLLDYYAREQQAPDVSSPALIGQAVANLPDPRVLGDIGAAIDTLSAHPRVDGEKIACWGFCIGGMYAFLAACEYGQLAGAVDFYGTVRYGETSERKPVSPLDRARDLNAPLIAHFGDFDRLISGDDVEALASALRENQKIYEFHTYQGAPHAFDEDFRAQVFRPVAARQAWSRSLCFLGWYLKGEMPR